MLAGDETAFEEFFEGHFPRLYRFALPRVGLDGDAAEEVVQSALCKALSALGSFRGEGALFSWLCTFCLHEIAAHWRRAGREPQPAGLIEQAHEARGGLVAIADGPLGPGAAGPERLEASRRVHETLDRLPSRYGDVLEWKYMEGLTVDEIAARLRIGVKAAESLLTRARLAFRRAFDIGSEENA